MCLRPHASQDSCDSSAREDKRGTSCELCAMKCHVHSISFTPTVRKQPAPRCLGNTVSYSASLNRCPTCGTHKTACAFVLLARHGLSCRHSTDRVPKQGRAWSRVSLPFSSTSFRVPQFSWRWGELAQALASEMNRSLKVTLRL